jgi:prolyl oligopeptidase
MPEHRTLARWLLCAAALTLSCPAMPQDKTPADDDPHLWLEDVQGEKALAWVRERNAETVKLLAAREDYAPTREKLLAVLNSRDRIPTVSRRGDWLYNLWQDSEHKRGLWRRATLAEYRKAEPRWETVIDLDALAAAERENWVWGGAECLVPTPR